MTDPRKELKIIPVKIIVSTDIDFSTNRAKDKTITNVRKPPIILKIGNVNGPRNGILIPRNKTKTAPTDAPEEIPSV